MISQSKSQSDPIRSRAVSLYDKEAERLSKIYESVTFEDIHFNILDLLPSKKSEVLDVGAGSGRDAAALAARDYVVTAVEPSLSMRNQAQNFHSKQRIEWLDDRLPNLFELGQRCFSLIIVSAVWMHLSTYEQDVAMQRLTKLLYSQGLLVISIRLAAADPQRAMHSIDIEEFLKMAQQLDLSLVRSSISDDVLGRANVSWAVLVFRKQNPLQCVDGSTVASA